MTATDTPAVPVTDNPLQEASEQRTYMFRPGGWAETVQGALAAAADAWTALQVARHPADLRLEQIYVHPVHSGGYRWGLQAAETYTRHHISPDRHADLMAAAEGWQPHMADLLAEAEAGAGAAAEVKDDALAEMRAAVRKMEAARNEWEIDDARAELAGAATDYFLAEDVESGG